MTLFVEPYRLIYATGVACLICYRSRKNKSLDVSGCAAAFIIGTITMYIGWRFAITMLAFFFSSSKIGKHTNEIPANRNWKQVCCNSLIGTICGVAYYCTLQTFDALPFLSSPYLSTFFLGGFLSFYACATADTWASEIGILSDTPPRLITNRWRIVPKGTNGGVTLYGLIASVCGGLFIGITFWFSSHITLQQVNDANEIKSDFEGMIESKTSQYWMIVIATLCGLFGSVLDSLLGATLQFSGVSMKQRDVISCSKVLFYSQFGLYKA